MFVTWTFWTLTMEAASSYGMSANYRPTKVGPYLKVLQTINEIDQETN